MNVCANKQTMLPAHPTTNISKKLLKAVKRGKERKRKRKKEKRAREKVFNRETAKTHEC